MPMRWSPSKSATVAVVLVPLSEGFLSTSSAIRSCARCSALLTRSSRSLSVVSGVGGVSSSLRSCAIAVLEAMSPRAAPPTPSHTAMRWGPTYPESWLSLRTRPTSEIAAKSNLNGLLPEFQDRLADPDLRAERDRGGLGDPDGADVGAVGGAEVLDEPLVAGGRGPRVARRDVVVVEPDRGVVAAADEDRRVVELGALAGVAALGHHDVRGAAAPLGRRLGALLLLAGLGAPGGLRHSRPEHVGADHRDRGEHEDPQDGQVGDPDQEEGELRHRTGLHRPLRGCARSSWCCRSAPGCRRGP